MGHGQQDLPRRPADGRGDGHWRAASPPMRRSPCGRPRRRIDKATELDRTTGYAFEIEAYNRTVGTEDRQEGINAFNEKRKPKYRALSRGAGSIPLKLCTRGPTIAEPTLRSSSAEAVCPTCPRLHRAGRPSIRSAPAYFAADAERRQGVDHAGGDRPAVRAAPASTSTRTTSRRPSSRR